jgi:hypothetical protein
MKIVCLVCSVCSDGLNRRNKPSQAAFYRMPGEGSNKASKNLGYSFLTLDATVAREQASVRHHRINTLPFPLQ